MQDPITRDQDARAERLLQEAVRRGLSRRAVIGRGLALGLSVPLLQAVLAAGGRRIAGAQGTPAPAGPVPILGRELSADDLKAEIEREGEVVVGNWTYTANDDLVQRFQDYVNATYGVGITLTYEGTQAPSTYLANLYAALASDNDSPYDVLAIEENYWAEALAQPDPVMEEFLPSPLIPNADLVLDQFKHYPTAIGFQASATPSIVYNKSKIDFLTDWQDLADERLRDGGPKITLPLPGDITCGGFFLGLAGSLGKDYTNVDQMKEVVDFTVEEIHPNVIRNTTDQSEMQQLLRSEAAWAVSFWNSLARNEFLSGQENTVALVASSGQYLANGYLWIPRRARHPVLAQIFVDWRLSPDAQFPNDWGIENGPWAELQEGLLGPSYEEFIPDWFADQYFTYYPTIEQLNQLYKPVDWAAYAAGVGEWMDYYTERLGL